MKPLLLSEIKGQPRAVEQARSTLDLIFREPDSPKRPILISGASACGKTLFSQAMEAEFVANGWNVKRLADASEARCLTNVSDLIDEISTGEKFVVFIDECQALLNGKGSEGVKRAFRAMVLPHGGEPVDTARIPLAAGEVKEIDFRNVLLVFMTNESDSIESNESRAKGDRPMHRRFNHIELSLYSHADMQEIIPLVLKRHGLQSTECSRGMIGRLHRGNMTALNDMIREYLKLFPGETRMSKEKVMRATALTSFWPRGVKRKTEGRMLKKLRESGGKIRKSLLAHNLGVDSRAVMSAVSYLEDQYSDSKHTPLVKYDGVYVELTENGRVYLDAVEKEGFTV